MPPMPAYLSWIIVEIAVAASLFAVILAISVYRLRRNYRSLCEDLEPHLAQLGSAFERLTDASRNLYKEVERLFSDPAGREGLERLETLRSGLDRQRQFIDELKSAPITPAFLLHEAVPALDKGITAYEKNLSLLLRQWDDALAAVASKAAQTAAAQLEEAEAHLASLRTEHEAQQKMQESLAAERRQAEERIRELQDALAKSGELERQNAEAQVQAEMQANEKTAALEERLRAAEAGKADNKHLQDHIAELQTSLRKLEAEMADTVPAQKKIIELESNLRAAQADQALCKQLQEETAKLEARLRDNEADQLLCNELQKEAAALQRANAELRSANEALLKEKAASQPAPEKKAPPESDPQAGARIVELEAQLQRLQQSLHEERPGPADSESELAEARRKLDELAMEVEISRATTDDINAALIKAKADLEMETRAFSEYRKKMESEMSKPKA